MSGSGVSEMKHKSAEPGVGETAFGSNSLPLSDEDWFSSLSLISEQESSSIFAEGYLAHS
jgi:hypothetical protein